MLSKDKSSGSKYRQLEPLKESFKSERSLEALLSRFEDKFDKLTSVLEMGIAAFSAHNDKLDRLASVVENGFTTFNSKALRRLGKMNHSMDSMVELMKASLSDSHLRGVDLKEREQSIPEQQHEHTPQRIRHEDEREGHRTGKSYMHMGNSQNGSLEPAELPNRTSVDAGEVIEPLQEKEGHFPSALSKHQEERNHTSSTSSEERLQLAGSREYGEFRDKNIVVVYGQKIEDLQLQEHPTIDQLRLYTAKWIGRSIDTILKESFQGYFSKQMNEMETRGFVCNNLLLNFLEMLRKCCTDIGLNWPQNSEALVHLFEQEVIRCLSFYLVKYPQKSKVFVSDQIKDLMKQINFTSLKEHSILRKLKLEFNPLKKVPKQNIQKTTMPLDYSRKIKELLNKLIKQSQAHFPAFKQLMKQVFTIGGTEETENSVQHLIGMKMKQDMPGYTEEQLRTPGVPIKRPEVLRILIKWTEQLDEIVFNPDTIWKLEEADMVLLSSIESDIRTEYLKELVACIKQHSKSHFEGGTADRGILDAAYRDLYPHITQRQTQFSVLPSSIVTSGMTVRAISEVTSHTAVLYLNGLIAFLYRMHKIAYQKLYEKGGCHFLKHDEEILRFSVMDLLRAKCSCTIQELKKVLHNFGSNRKINILRVKNRLATGNRDYLINFTFEECPLICEIQIGLKDTSDQKSSFQDHFNHFLYELVRSKFGPLSESALIIAYQNDIGAYFKKQTKRIRTSVNRLDFNLQIVDGVLDVQGFEKVSSECVFICSNCLEISETATKLLGNWKQKSRNAFLCGSCISTKLNSDQQMSIVLGSEIAKFFSQRSWKEQTEHPSEHLVMIESETLGTIGVYSTHRPPGHSIVKMVLEIKPEFSDVMKDYVFKSLYYKCFIPIEALYDNKIVKNKRLFSLKPELVIINLNLSLSFQKSDKSLKKKIAECIIDPQEGQKKLPYLTLEDEFDIYWIFSSDIVGRLSSFQEVRCAVNYQDKTVLVLDKALNLQQLISIEEQALVGDIDSTRFNEKGLSWTFDNKNYDQSTFNDLTQDDIVQIAVLSRNNFKRIDFFKSRSLMRMTLQHNKIVAVQVNENYPLLMELFLTDNKITQLNFAAISTLRVLKVLDVSHNRIGSITTKRTESGKDEPSLSMLERLNLGFNKIKALDLRQSDFPGLRQFNIQFNSELTELDLNGFTQLIDIDFGHTGITCLKMSGKYPTLVNFVGESTKLTELDLSSLELPLLSRFELSHGTLRRISLPKLTPRLRILDLSCNFLEEVDLRSDELIADGKLLSPEHIMLRTQIYNEESNKLTKLDLRCLRTDINLQLYTLDVSRNPPIEILLPQDFFVWQIPYIGLRDIDNEGLLWPLTLLNDKTNEAFYTYVKVQMYKEAKQVFDISTIHYITKTIYLETFDIPNFRQRNQQTVEWTIKKFSEFFRSNKLKHQYPSIEAILQPKQERRVRIFRAPKNKEDNPYEPNGLVIDRQKLDIGVKCQDCGARLGKQQYYFFTSRIHRCVACSEAETGDGQGLSKYRHLENAILINCLDPFVDVLRLGSNIQPKTEDECFENFFVCGSCKSEVIGGPRFICLDCRQREQSSNAISFCQQCVKKQREPLSKETKQLTPKMHKHEHSLLRIPYVVNEDLNLY